MSGKILDANSLRQKHRRSPSPNLDFLLVSKHDAFPHYRAETVELALMQLRRDRIVKIGISTNPRSTFAQEGIDRAFRMYSVAQPHLVGRSRSRHMASISFVFALQELTYICGFILRLSRAMVSAFSRFPSSQALATLAGTDPSKGSPR